jgi:hypothetical protein
MYHCTINVSLNGDSYSLMKIINFPFLSLNLMYHKIKLIITRKTHLAKGSFVADTIAGYTDWLHIRRFRIVA